MSSSLMAYRALILTAVNLLLRLISTSFQVYISGLIGAAGMGLLQLVLSVGSLAMTAGMAGIRTATMYLTANALGRRHPENVGHILSACFLYSILCSSAVAGLLYGFAPGIAEHWIGDIRALPAIGLLAAFLPVNCLCGVMAGYFTAAGRIGTLAAVEVAEQLFSMAVTVSALLFWAGADPEKACQAVVLGSGAGSLLTLSTLFLLRILEKAPKGKSIPVRSQLLQTAVPLAVADDLKVGINTVENLMVPKRLALYPHSADPLAAFGTVCGMVFPVLMFPAAFLYGLAELLIPEMARCAAAESHIRIKYLARRSLRVALIYGLLFGGLMFLVAQPLCMDLYRSSLAGKILMLFAPLAPMLYCDAIVDAMNKGLGQQKICVRYNILTSLMDVSMLFVMLPIWGINGYFISFAISHIVNFILSLGLLIRTTRLKVRSSIPIKAVLCAAGAVLLSAIPVIPAVRALCFIASFFSLLALFGVVTKEDLRWVKGLILIKKLPRNPSGQR